MVAQMRGFLKNLAKWSEYKFKGGKYRIHYNVGTCLRHVSVQSTKINALETCQRHVPTLWRCLFGRVRHVMNNWHTNQVCSHNNITRVEKNIKLPC